MKKILTLGLLSFISTATLAAPQQCNTNPERGPGHWRVYEEQVCDIRTVMVDVPKTLCEYEFRDPNYNSPPPGQTEVIKINKVGHTQCEQSIGVFIDDPEYRYRNPGYNPPPQVRLNVRLSSQTHYTAQQQSTEQYNCRMEERRVWVSHCDHPGNRNDRRNGQPDGQPSFQ